MVNVKGRHSDGKINGGSEQGDRTKKVGYTEL